MFAFWWMMMVVVMSMLVMMILMSFMLWWVIVAMIGFNDGMRTLTILCFFCLISEFGFWSFCFWIRHLLIFFFCPELGGMWDAWPSISVKLADGGGQADEGRLLRFFECRKNVSIIATTVGCWDCTRIWVSRGNAGWWCRFICGWIAGWGLRGSVRPDFWLCALLFLALDRVFKARSDDLLLLSALILAIFVPSMTLSPRNDTDPWLCALCFTACLTRTVQWPVASFCLSSCHLHPQHDVSKAGGAPVYAFFAVLWWCWEVVDWANIEFDESWILYRLV